MLPAACASVSHCLVFSELGRFKSEGLNAGSKQVWLPGMGSSTYGRDGRKSSSPVFQPVARIPWRPSIARQTGGKKCFHMPCNLQTATIEPWPAYFSPFPLGIQTQLFSEIASSRGLALWLSRARKLVIYTLGQSLELLFQGFSVFSL